MRMITPSQALSGHRMPAHALPTNLRGANFVMPIRKNSSRFRALAYTRARIWPIKAGLGFLLAINIIFMANIETTLHQAGKQQDAGELDWTFGQTLALLLLILPLRDVFEYIAENAKVEYAKKCTKDLANAIKAENLSAALDAARFADNVQIPINGKLI
jgi:hypothetical protein